MAPSTIVTLLTKDLRVHDNALLRTAHFDKEVDHVLPLYVFDERSIELSGLPDYSKDTPPAKTRLCKFWRTGVFRARFLSEAVYDLRDRLRSKKSDLLIRFGKPEVVAANVVKALQENGHNVKAVFMQKDFYSEEIAVERRLEKALKKLGVPLTFFDTTPLIDIRDLPFSVEQTPDVFTPFRKRVEALGKLGRPPLEMPSSFKPTPPFSDTTTSQLNDYGSALDGKGVEDVLPDLLRPLEDSYETKFSDSRSPWDEKSAFPYRGGETPALERLDWYFHEGSPPSVAKYKETRNGLLGHGYSTKLSPFLCLGMISPRLIMQSLDEHEKEYGSSQNTYWVRFEMLWRDYFLYIARKYGTNLFKLGSLEAVTDPKQAKYKMEPGWWKEWDPNASQDSPCMRWLNGTTGVPFIDANMSELRETGFMSNRGRQNVASFLTKDLRVDWRVGAEFFESHLIDYEPSANYGNWAYVAGVGNDPRASRQFNPIKQGNDYDPYGEYIKTWLPSLTKVPTHRIQAPWMLTPSERAQYIEDDRYPASPVIEQPTWKPHYTKKGPGKLHGNPNERIRGGMRTGSGAALGRSGSEKGHGARGDGIKTVEAA
ncbi:Cryptochrome DASH [Pseudohyphozyma bogoriensis]|nr:Cryptochrome DASH [Pseudohyphozyma bogoriensis]